MIGQRGPNGERHVPEQRSGCYYGRMDDCCALCTWRLILAQLAVLLRIGTSRSPRDHGPAGTEVLVPTLREADDPDVVDHVSGEVTEIYDVERSRNAFAVRLDDGETLAVTIERVD